MLCHPCQTAVREAFTAIQESSTATRSVHATYNGFLGSLIKGCLICRSMWGDMRETKLTYQSLDDYHLLSEWLQSSEDPVPETLKPMIFFLSQWPCEPGLFELQLTRYQTITSYSLICRSGKHPTSNTEAIVYFHALPRPLDSTNSTTDNDNKWAYSTCTSLSQALWRHWVRTCSETHDQCRQPSTAFLPKRLIKIFPDENDAAYKWKLTEWNPTIPGRPKAYLTLSHCWGTSQHTCLRTTNIKQFMAENMVSDLVKTYRDAMNITLALGHRYLWIDSLCIIQSDAADWEEQSTLMGLVYKHATCNIAATWAVDGTQGCFHNRDPALVQHTSVPTEVARSGMVLELIRFNKLQFEINTAPLNHRAWVMQERYLAPRQLNFAADEVFWECPQLVASEQYPNGIPGEVISWSLSDYTSIAKGLKPRLNYGNEQTLRRIWNGLIGTYTTLQLTVYTDKVIAVAGLAGELRERLRDVYLAGMWRTDLHRQLCWRTSARSGKMRARADVYLAPSWSWLSVDALVWPDENYHNAEGRVTVYYVEVMEASVKARDPSGLHSFVSGSLTVRGIAMWVSIHDLDGKAILTQVRVTGVDMGRSAAFAEALGGYEADFAVKWDENGKEVEDIEMLKAMKLAGHSEFLFLFCNLEYSRSSAQEDAGPPLPWLRRGLPASDTQAETYTAGDINGLILIPKTDGKFSRVAKFSRMGGGLVPALVAGRLGLEPGVHLADKINFGDPRLAGLVQTVTIA